MIRINGGIINIAQRQIAYYESEDFVWEYVGCLSEMFDEDYRGIIKNAIEEDFEITPTNDQVNNVKKFIQNNLDKFVETYSNYCAGNRCIANVDFGEQEVQLADIYNHRTKKNYDIRYLRRIFEKEGFYVNGNYAYYNMESSGIMIEFKPLEEIKWVLNGNLRYDKREEEFLDHHFLINP